MNCFSHPGLENLNFFSFSLASSLTLILSALANLSLMPSSFPTSFPTDEEDTPEAPDADLLDNALTKGPTSCNLLEADLEELLGIQLLPDDSADDERRPLNRPPDDLPGAPEAPGDPLAKPAEDPPRDPPEDLPRGLPEAPPADPPRDPKPEKLPGETLLDELLEDPPADLLEELSEDLLGDLLEELLKDPLLGDPLEDPEVLSLESDPSTEPLDEDPSRCPELLEALTEAILLLSSAGGEGEGEDRPSSGAGCLRAVL